MFRFKEPLWLLLLLIPAAYIYIRYFTKFLKPAVLGYSNVRLLVKIGYSWKSRMATILPFVKALGIALLVIALAQPQTGYGESKQSVEGVDIMLILDTSYSMKAEDFKPNNRLYVAKEVLDKFIDSRESDRLGLVVFAKRSFTQCPLTIDYDLLKNLLASVDFGMVDGERTAIGLAIANATNRLKDSSAKSKIIILLTDGVNNVDDLNPLDAARAAAALGIRIYTIGAGRPGLVDYPNQTPFGIQYVKIESEMDENTLTEIADITGGKFYRAKDANTLEYIYQEISKLEKTKVEVQRYYRYDELFARFLMAGLAVLLLEFFLSRTAFGGIPE